MHVQNRPNDKLVSYLRQLGLLTDEVEVYLYLLKSGSQSVLDISRGMQTGRTKLYPLLDKLAGEQLVTVSERHYGTSYQAASPETLALLVNKQEQLSHTLRDGLPAALHSLKQLQQASPSVSKLTEYHDLDGIKQMYWNISHAKTDFFILELPDITKQIGNHLKNKLLSVLTEKEINGHILSNQKNAAAPTVHIEHNTYKIEFETYVYNNTVSLASYNKGIFYGIEIQNPHLARQYRQILSILMQNTA